MEASKNVKLGSRSRIYTAPASDINTLEAVHEWFDRFYQEDVSDAVSRFKRLRAEGPVVHGVGMDFGEVVVPDLWNWHDRPSAMALTYDAVTTLLTNPDRFGHRLYAAELGEQNPLFQDGEGHRDFRRMVIKAFNPLAVRRWELVATELANALVDGFAHRGRAELVTQYARRLPGQVFTAFMGAPIADSERLSAWATRQMKGHDPQTAEAIKLLHAYISNMIADRRGLAKDELAKRQDLVSLLAAVDLNGRCFNDVEINTTLHVLLIGGADTVYKALSSTLFFLLTEVGMLGTIRQDRTRIPRLVEESVRLASPNVFGAARLTLADTELEGVPIKAGTAVIANIAMANRDTQRWTEPERLDLDREQTTHAGWGMGPHTCLGMHLARLVVISAINVLLDRCPDVALDPAKTKPRLAGVGSLWCKHLDVNFTPS